MRADDLAREVLHRVADPARLDRAIAFNHLRSTLPASVQWRPHTVAAGFAGTAMLFAAADARWPEERWDRVGHAHLAAARTALERARPVGAGIFTGLAGVGMAALALDASRGRYQGFLAAVDAALEPIVAAAVRRLDGVRGCAVSAFDVISGLAGVGAYLLARPPTPALRQLVGGLTRLLAAESRARRWHTPAALAGESLAAAHPDGCHNCGLAHGVPGPLALLAMAELAGAGEDGTAEAVAVTASWLASVRVEREWGVEWPNAVGLDQDAPLCPAPMRTAWCYGAPGVARSLWLAGSALDDEKLRDLAVDTMIGIGARTAAQRGLAGPTYCHGLAGLLAVTARFAADTGRAEFGAAVDGLVDELTATYEPGTVLGFRNVELGGARVDHPGLLDGAPGVALALATIDTPTPSAWHRLFLIG